MASAEVESVLDAAHALMGQGVFRYRRAAKLNLAEYERAGASGSRNEERDYSDLWRTVPRRAHAQGADARARPRRRERKQRLRLPEENLLYFLEKNSPILQDWQRELLRIVRNVAQYFYPQRQTKLMNEGCATFVHYYIVNKLYDRGPDQRRRAAGDPAQPFQRRLSGRLRRSALFRPQPLCARLCDDAGHPAHLRRADRRGSRMVPRHRRPRGLARRAARRLGQLSRRVVRATVPEPASDPQVEAVPARRQRKPRRPTASTRSTTARAIARCARRSPTATTPARANPTSRSPTSTFSATANSSCATTCATACKLGRPGPRSDAAPHPPPLGLRRQARGSRGGNVAFLAGRGTGAKPDAGLPPDAKPSFQRRAGSRAVRAMRSPDICTGFADSRNGRRTIAAPVACSIGPT